MQVKQCPHQTSPPKKNKRNKVQSRKSKTKTNKIKNNQSNKLKLNKTPRKEYHNKKNGKKQKQKIKIKTQQSPWPNSGDVQSTKIKHLRLCWAQFEVVGQYKQYIPFVIWTKRLVLLNEAKSHPLLWHWHVAREQMFYWHVNKHLRSDSKRYNSCLCYYALFGRLNWVLLFKLLVTWLTCHSQCFQTSTNSILLQPRFIRFTHTYR